MEIEYDPAKDAKNVQERGLRFERAREFDFNTAVIKLVQRNGELRWVAKGYLTVYCMYYASSFDPAVSE